MSTPPDPFAADRPWYTRSPWREIVSHSAAVCVAILFATLVRRCTGVAVTIEASAPKPQAPNLTAAPEESVEIEWVSSGADDGGEARVAQSQSEEAPRPPAAAVPARPATRHVPIAPAATASAVGLPP